jgi:hypothetical protein
MQEQLQFHQFINARNETIKINRSRLERDTLGSSWILTYYKTLWWDSRG